MEANEASLARRDANQSHAESEMNNVCGTDPSVRAHKAALASEAPAARQGGTRYLVDVPDTRHYRHCSTERTPVNGAPPASGPLLERVLVALDLAEADKRQAAPACPVVRPEGEVRLVAVNPRVPRNGHRTRRAKCVVASGRHASARMEALVPRAARRGGIRRRAELVEHSESARVLCQIADRIDADLICRGARQRRCFHETPPGSVSRWVTARSGRLHWLRMVLDVSLATGRGSKPQPRMEAEMRIVCGTDFSIHAGKAADVAAALAGRTKTTLRLLHGVEQGSAEFLPQATVEDLRERLRRRMVTEGDRLRATGVGVTESVALGRPHELLASAARSSMADLVVVSTLGQVSPGQWLGGSVAEKTAQLSPVPTLVVRDHEALLSWARGERTLRLSVGYDFSPSADAALRWVAALRRVGHCRITVTYVFWPPKETWRFGVGDDAPPTGNNLAVRTLLERDLKERCARALGKGRRRVLVIADWGPADERLIQLAKSEAADLIVVGTNQRRGLSRFWLGSVSRGVLHHAPTNVVCVPAAHEPESGEERIPAYRRVLVPTDFSRQGNRAITFAYGAASRGGEVCLIHVVPPTGGLRPDRDDNDGSKGRLKQVLTARLEALIPEEARPRGIRSRVEVVEHQQADAAISQAAERFAADLICIGSRGRSGLRRKLLGSVTERLMRRSSRPVLVIRE